MAMLNSALVDHGEDTDGNDNYALHHGDDGSDGVSGGLLAARSHNDRGAQVPGDGGGGGGGDGGDGCGGRDGGDCGDSGDIKSDQ